ncbi:uncharacterized protein [Diadema antillarum]|uniref:uncharacterized protein n=1 Tax=Diadema antillarum TaxID=105358 RepID=UPI003A86FBD9
MDVTYTIGVSDRFLLGFDSVSDPQDIFAENEQHQKEKKEKSSKHAKQHKKPEQASAKKAPEPEQKTRRDDSRQERNDRTESGRRRDGGGRGGRGGNQDRPNFRRNRDNRRSVEGQDHFENQENQAPSEFRSSGGDRPQRDYRDQGERPPRTEYRDQGDRPRGRGRGRGGRGGRGGFGGSGGGREFRGNKREFDRHSGSDKSSSYKAQEKRDGGGQHNWGNVKDDVKDLNTSNATDESAGNPEWTPQTDGEPNENAPSESVPKEGEENEVNAEDGEEKEPENKEMTLDEYKELQAKERAKSQFNLRRAGEGEDNSQWKQTYILKKEAAKDGDADKHPDIYPKDRPNKQAASDLINFTFADQQGGGRGRGGRRGGRGGPRGGGPGGRGRGGDRDRDRDRDRAGRGGRGGFGGGAGGGGGGRGGRYRDESAILVDNEEEFPSLTPMK